MPAATTCPACGLEVSPDTEYCPRDGTDLSEAVGRDATVRRDSLAGAKLGDYVIKQRIGAGGMGIVYEGLQPMIGKRVAIKVLRTEFAEDPIQVQRLLAEARAVNAIRHRGIIDIFGFGEVPDGRQYIVMEYLSGQPLDAVILERGALSGIEALPILDEVTAALSAAHGAGVIHRDLKPSNIFVVSQPDGSRYIKLLDFGLAKSTMGSSGQTRVTQVVGTPEYMAPEQAKGEQLGPWTDLYALGVVAFELLTGQIPFDGKNAVDVAMKHIEAPPPAPSTVDGSIPPELDRLILRLMAKRPEERPASAEVVRMEIKRILRLLTEASTRIHASARAPLKPLVVPATTKSFATPTPVGTPTPTNGKYTPMLGTPTPLGVVGVDATMIGAPPAPTGEVTATTPVGRPAVGRKPVVKVARPPPRSRARPLLPVLVLAALFAGGFFGWRVYRARAEPSLPIITPVSLDQEDKPPPPPAPVPVPATPPKATSVAVDPSRTDPDAPVRLQPAEEPRPAEPAPPPPAPRSAMSATTLAAQNHPVSKVAPTKRSLLARIDRDEHTLRAQRDGNDETSIPMLTLHDWRERVQKAKETAAEMWSFSASLDEWELQYLRTAPER